jgi:hypothetical protein
MVLDASKPERRERGCRHILCLAFLLGIGGALLPIASARAQAPALPPEWDKVRAALEKYQDPYVAVRDGYLSTIGCVHYPKPGGAGQIAFPTGGMGIHFLNPELIAPVPDPMRPAILLYEPNGDKLRLVGAEWFIPLSTGVKERPTLFGQPFDGPMEGHEPLMPHSTHHYDLHVWLWKENPAGLFKPTNPTLTCAGYGYSLAEDWPRLMPHPQH